MLIYKDFLNAEGGTRTPIELPPQDPEPCVSTNSTTSAQLDFPLIYSCFKDTTKYHRVSRGVKTGCIIRSLDAGMRSKYAQINSAKTA